jgi:hypothetical protein
MASIATWAANIAVCGGCRQPLQPNTKADGGIVFGAVLVHRTKPALRRDLCGKYGYAPTMVVPVAAPGPKLTAHEKRLARMLRSNDRLTAEREAQRVRDEAFAASGHDFGAPEPTDAQVWAHRSKLQPGEDCVDERCFYCGSPNHFSKDCLTI